MNKFLRFFILVGALVVFGFNLVAQREYVSYSQNKGTIYVKTNDGTYSFQPYLKKLMHIKFIPDSIEVKEFSYAQAMNPEKVRFLIQDRDNELEIETPGIKVKITKSPFQVNYYYHADLIIAEKNGYQITDSSQRVDFNLTKDEILYGGGARVLGMNRRGNLLKLYNRAHYGYGTHSELMNFTLPMVISSNKYAVLFDNASSGYLDLDSEGNNTLAYDTYGGTVNYYLMIFNDWYELTEINSQLTGRQPLPPRWAFGNFSSRFGYHSQKEVLNTVDKFFEDDIPVDAAIIDIYWFGKDIKGAMGNLNWYKDSFPEPVKMMDKLENQGVKTVLVTEPFILTTSDRWEEAVENEVLATDSAGEPYTYDFYFGNTGLIDIFKPEARDWFWGIYKKFTKQGVDGWWGDLGEPEVHPSGLQHVNGSADEVHNAYGHEWAHVIYDGFRNDFPNTRPFILMRAGYAGSQRYGMIPWTGDVSRSWGGLVSQPEISLQMGMQGLGYMHSDLGGFADGVTIDNELYIRWLQYGVYQPIYRPHAQEHIPAEPVFQNDTTKAHVKKAIELRYKLLPYIYNMAFENNQTGKPLMIPLFFNEPDNSDLLTYDKAYMWGDAFLVSPIKQPGVKEQTVYLPKGNKWIEFNTEKIFDGGQEVTVAAPLDYIPVFVKGGAFVPMSKTEGNTSKYNLDQFEVHFYYDSGVKNAKYTMYNDDGKTVDALKKQQYEEYSFSAANDGKELTLVMNKMVGKYFKSADETGIDFSVHALAEKPGKVEINGTKLKKDEWSFDETTRVLRFNFSVRNKKVITIKL